jgi:hypothetical protein
MILIGGCFGGVGVDDDGILMGVCFEGVGGAGGILFS